MTRPLFRTLLVAGGAFVGGLCASALFDARSAAVAQNGSPLPAPPLPSDRPPQPGGGDRFVQVAQQIAPAVVSVDAVKPPAAAPLVAGGKAKPVEESGSGVIVRLAGARGCYAVSNVHVIGAAAASAITVTRADGLILRPERVWTDAESDVAVLQLPGDDHPTAPLADSDRVRVGQWVIAVGSPFGLSQTVTHGIISAKDRGQISLGDTIRIKEFLQTDAAINPGSSGGPLVDLDGAVVGINTAIASNNGNNSGVSFSIPSNLVRRIARELLEKGVVARGYLGLQLAPNLEPAAALRMGLSRLQGALVQTVHPGGPAAAGGLRPGDVILKLEDVEVRNENHFINLVGTLPINQRVRLTVWRDRRSAAVDLTVGDWNRFVGTAR